MSKPSDIRIREVRTAAPLFQYRCPIKFGGRVLNQVTLLNVLVRVETRAGSTTAGFSSMPLGNIWAYPTDRMTYDETLAAMEALAERIATALPQAGGGEALHPVELAHRFTPELMDLAATLSAEMNLPVPIPPLASLVVNSAFDAAIHDAFGKSLGMNCYDTYGPEHMNHDLGHYLDDDFKGEHLDRYTLRDPKDTMPLYHLVGALDALVDGDVVDPVGDGLPETLGQWIGHDELTHLKIKLNGDNLDWDVERVLSVNRVADEAAAQYGPRDYQFSLDFNEKCENVQYLLEFLARVEEQSGTALDRVQYIEQPTARDLKAHPDNTMHEATKIKPVVIDESLLDYESLLLSMEMGYSGVALKACKGQSESLVLGAAAQKKGLFLCVQDLTCVGASFLHSAGLAARVPTVAAIEGNGRQYCPAANEEWSEVFPDVFAVKKGCIETGVLIAEGLGCVPAGEEEKHL